MRTSWRDVCVERDRVTVVDNHKTALVMSKKCNMTYIIAIDDICLYHECFKSCDLDKIKEKCEKEKFSTDFVITQTDDNGVAFVMPAKWEFCFLLVISYYSRLIKSLIVK